MGVIQFEDFPQLVHAATRPVGRWPIQEGTITRIGRAPEGSEHAGQLVFLDEIPATMKVAEKIVPFRRQQLAGVTGEVAKWWRVEVQVRSNEKRVTTKMDMVLARRLGTCWVTHSPVKGSYKKGEYGRRNPLHEPAQDVEDLIRRLESLSYDYWETGKFLTAGFSIPTDTKSVERRNYSRGGFLLGVCENAVSCRDELWTSPAVRELLDLTDRGTIRFWPMRGKIAERNKKLHPTAREDAQWLMDIAIWQTLAGTDKPKLLGCPVTTLIERVYKNRLYNRNRNLVRVL